MGVCVGGGGYGGFISPVRTIYWPVWMTHVEGGGVLVTLVRFTQSV